MTPITPKTSWYARFVVSGSTTVIGTEDENFWKADKQGVVRLPDMKEVSPTEVLVLAEILQKADDPVALLKEAAVKTKKLLIVVPNEWNWNPQFKPFSNPTHRWNFDTESLAKALDEAGLTYTISLIEFGGWSFVNAEVVGKAP